MRRTIPIIRFKQLLLVSIQIELSDDLVAQLRDDLAIEMASEDVEGLVIEVSGIDVFDSYIACSVRDVAHVAKLMGVETVLAGLDSALAITLVEMGMDMKGVRTALNLEGAVEMLEESRQKLSDEMELTIEEVSHEETDWAFLTEG